MYDFIHRKIENNSEKIHRIQQWKLTAEKETKCYQLYIAHLYIVAVASVIISIVLVSIFQFFFQYDTRQFKIEIVLA